MVPSDAHQEATEILLPSFQLQDAPSVERAPSKRIFLVGSCDAWAQFRQRSLSMAIKAQVSVWGPLVTRTWLRRRGRSEPHRRGHCVRQGHPPHRLHASPLL